MCNWIHICQWGLAVAGVKDLPIDEPVDDLAHSLAKTQLWLDDCLVTMEQSIMWKLELLFCTGGTLHTHSYPETCSVNSSTQDESQGGGAKETDWIEDTTSAKTNKTLEYSVFSLKFYFFAKVL